MAKTAPLADMRFKYVELTCIWQDFDLISRDFADYLNFEALRPREI